jgi:murein DD-endopeptidase MepM/ murein hydrolase activator NlpD
MKVQLPIDGKLGKNFKVTSPFGWRIHPITKKKKHHNGVDLWSSKEPCYVESFYKGTVITAGPSRLKKANGEPDGYGYYVTVRHMINGDYYTSVYAHMLKGSLQVKVGDKVEAGTVLGKMGTSGASTGKHLHWEIWKGKTHGWTDDGRGFVEPIEFAKALMAMESAKGSAPVATPKDAPVAPAPVHGTKPKAAKPVAKTAAKPAAKPVAKKPAAKKPAKAAQKVSTDYAPMKAE